jgi:hypothetical protein
MITAPVKNRNTRDRTSVVLLVICGLFEKTAAETRYEHRACEASNIPKEDGRSFAAHQTQLAQAEADAGPAAWKSTAS